MTNILGFVHHHLLHLTVLLLLWHYSPMQTFALLKDFCHSTLFFFYLSFKFVMFHLLISVFTQFHRLFFWLSCQATPLRIIVKYLNYFCDDTKSAHFVYAHDSPLAGYALPTIHDGRSTERHGTLLQFSLPRFTPKENFTHLHEMCISQPMAAFNQVFLSVFLSFLS